FDPGRGQPSQRWSVSGQRPASPSTSESGALSLAAASLDSALAFAASTPSSVTFRIRTQQRATWFTPTSLSDGSGSVLHLSMTKGQRGWNLQPGGGLDRSGGRPRIETSLSLRASSTRGTERSSDHVYGCWGLLKICSTGPSSTILPAYITTT